MTWGLDQTEGGREAIPGSSLTHPTPVDESLGKTRSTPGRGRPRSPPPRGGGTWPSWGSLPGRQRERRPEPGSHRGTGRSGEGCCHTSGRCLPDTPRGAARAGAGGQAGSGGGSPAPSCLGAPAAGPGGPRVRSARPSAGGRRARGQRPGLGAVQGRRCPPPLWRTPPTSQYFPRGKDQITPRKGGTRPWPSGLSQNFPLEILTT